MKKNERKKIEDKFSNAISLTTREQRDSQDIPIKVMLELLNPHERSYLVEHNLLTITKLNIDMYMECSEITLYQYIRRMSTFNNDFLFHAFNWGNAIKPLFPAQDWSDIRMQMMFHNTPLA